MGHEVADRVGVADDKALKPEHPAQDLGEQPAVPGRRDAVEIHVARHDVARPGLQRRRERREVHIPQLGVGEVDLVVVTPAERRAVAGEVLGTGDHALGRADLLPLEAADLGGRDGGAEERVLARALDDAAPARIAGDVDHRRERPVDARGACLTRGDGLTAFDRLRIPRGGQRDRHRKDRAQPMDHVKAEQHRDPEPMTLDREPLQTIDLPWIGHEQQRTRTAHLQSRLDHLRLTVDVQAESRLDLCTCRQAHIEVLAQLPGLLGHGHLGDQLVDPQPDRLLISHVEHSPRGLVGIVPDRAHRRVRGASPESVPGRGVRARRLDRR